MMRRTLFFATLIVFAFSLVNVGQAQTDDDARRSYNGAYVGPYLDRVAFPIGGIGAGMFCLEGTGAISHVSMRNRPDVTNEPLAFAALCVKRDEKNVAKVIEGPIPIWKYFGKPQAGRGLGGTSYGLPRFGYAKFNARFPFATIDLLDDDVPMGVTITGFSPFIPTDADGSSLPVGSLEYRFRNKTDAKQELVFSFNTQNFMSVSGGSRWRSAGKAIDAILPFDGGFVLWQAGTTENPENQGACAIFVDEDNVVVNHRWFRGGWWDPLTITWRNVEQANPVDHAPVDGSVPGASLYVPFTLEPGQEKTIRLMFAWHVPNSTLRAGQDLPEAAACEGGDCESGDCVSIRTYVPWYASKFKSVKDVADYWRNHYDDLRKKSALFRDTFYDTTLPGEVIEAVAANLTILKSPTVMRQADGRLWCWEGCNDDSGCCHGSCTHVWNYAQAIPHLFAELERSLRQTEFQVSQDATGHQVFRSGLPIRPVQHGWHAAADGQLGGIMKVYREWRISGDSIWIKSIWPKVKQSLDYCIKTWDPKGKGILEEPHHNTYDIEYWGPNGHCTSFYLGALTAAIEIGRTLRDDVSRYEQLLAKGKQYMQQELFDGEYFVHKIQWEGLQAEDPVKAAQGKWNLDYSPEALELLKKEGPKYQYGKGCLSDGVLGLWIARVCGLDEPIIKPAQVQSHLKAVHKYNLRKDLLDHANPQRPSFAMGVDGGLLLCTWPKGGELSLPFVYSDEVWTGIEYQVASHLMLEGLVDRGLEIVRVCRDRYDGRIRNPFNEYECGHWYARAMSSYGLLQGLTGVRYDAVDKTLYIDSKIGDDFRSFLSTAGGFGTVGLKGGKPFIDVKYGKINVKRVMVSGKQTSL